VCLPGLDGAGLGARRQFPALSRRFDVRLLALRPEDRRTLPELVDGVERAVLAATAGDPPSRPVYLLGESMGGMLALLAAARLGAERCHRLVLVNPATSFARSVWADAGPLLPGLPDPLYEALPLGLAPVLGDPLRLAAAAVDPGSPLPAQASQLAAGLGSMGSTLGELTVALPKETLAHRMQLLREGAEAAEAALADVEQRVLVLCSENDLLLPSREEGERLKRRLLRCETRVLEGSGHAALQEGGMDLLAILEDTGFYTAQRRMSSAGAGPAPKGGPEAVAGAGAGAGGRPGGGRRRRGTGASRYAVPVEIPTDQEVRQTVQNDRQLRVLRTVASPVFYSTDAQGAIVRGLGNVPEGRPILFVGNHQTFAPDLSLIITQFLQEKGVLLRGLAHPAVAAGAGAPGEGPREGRERSGGAGGPALWNRFASYGAVPVSPFAMYNLLSHGEAVLLFPGGAREACKGRGEEYQLFWPQDGEFVRMAAKFGATIVPFSAIGADESVSVVANADELLELPVVGEWLRGRLQDIPTVRKENREEFMAPLVVPKSPERFYFLFGRPVQLSPEDARDREEMAEVYRGVKAAVRQGIEYLMGRRALDPYAGFLRRQLYEASRGEQAPSADP